ncbi:zinc-binding alcohol dehydrogenase [Marinobacter halodurans]|uniref:Zinc-binding alcohol dehydrogenase n=1 Tax=Marinobacter halodurans TaxID=2528979 RepID=A0ABY1ZKT3_9GAMM|nr:zinc-binding alcohol dehydrogenase [Marinobacter halodurans]TBW51549.1 zinc-binding alcohol dehydrogenase [Marinobacter halodurans]
MPGSGTRPDYQGRAFWVTGYRKGELRPVQVSRQQLSETGDVIVETLYSGISRGTESLVFNGRVPETEYERMRCPFQEGEFPYPVKYGYANVGRVLEGPVSLRNRLVFSLFPHQTCFRIPEAAVVPLPDTVPPERAILAANLETAVNALWDATPRVGDRAVVIGCGVVGCLVAWLLSRIPGTRVQAVDPDPGKAAVLERLGVRWRAESDGRDDHDLVIHASGHPEGLDTALAMAGVEGRIVEMSWYGDRPVPLNLGGAFHSRRLSLIASQVGRIAPAQAPRWSHRDRMALALTLLQAPELDVLINANGDFTELPKAMATVTAPDSGVLCHRVNY